MECNLIIYPPPSQTPRRPSTPILKHNNTQVLSSEPREGGSPRCSDVTADVPDVGMLAPPSSSGETQTPENVQMQFSGRFLEFLPDKKPERSKFEVCDFVTEPKREITHT